MKEYKRENWRTCQNCVHNTVCTKKQFDIENCTHHIYNANPKRYGDFREFLEYICLWLKTHYPNDTVLLIDKNSAKLLIDKEHFYTKEIIDCTLGDMFNKQEEELKE